MIKEFVVHKVGFGGEIRLLPAAFHLKITETVEVMDLAAQARVAQPRGRPGLLQLAGRVAHGSVREVLLQ